LANTVGFDYFGHQTRTMNSLTERQQNLCVYGGLFGAMLTATCLIQHIALSTNHWIAFVLMGVYAYTLLVFILLAFQRMLAPLLLITSSSLIMISLVFVLAGGFYSLALILLFLYCTVITIVIYMEQLPSKLKQKALIKRQEEMAWRDKI
jgi:CHASE2 domain-containing sensor protein